VVSLDSKALDFRAASECITGSKGEEADGLLEMTYPDKPRSSKQRYRLIARGREILQEQKENS
jgi:hypothetical protein